MRALQPTEVSRRASSAADDGTPSLARPIMIIDDDASSRFLLGEALTALGLGNPIVDVVDGDQALTELRRCVLAGGQHLPALILLDQQMPGRTGLEVLQWMRLTPGLEEVAVVMVSGSDDAGGVTKAYELGVGSYLVKPIAFTALAAVVRNLHLPWLLA